MIKDIKKLTNDELIDKLAQQPASQAIMSEGIRRLLIAQKFHDLGYTAPETGER